MRRVVPIILITALSTGVVYAFPSGGELARQPWLAAFLLLAGMALIISQTTVSGGWRASGVVGLTCISLALASQMVAKTANWIGLLLLVAGALLLVMEARVIPGHGISAVGGVSGVFAGMYLILASTITALFAVLLSAMIAIMSFLILLIYVSASRNWREMNRRVTVSVGHSQITKVGVAAQSTTASVIPTPPIAHSVREDRASYTTTGPEIIERMKGKCSGLRASSVPIIANHLKIERALAVAKSKREHACAEARKAASTGRDDLARTLLMECDICDHQVKELSEQSAVARRHSDAAKLRIEDFRKELLDACRRVGDAHVRGQLAGLVSQAGEFTSLTHDVLERMESSADTACGVAEGFGRQELSTKTAELEARKVRAAEALAKLKEELRRTPQTDESKQQFIGESHRQD